MEIEGGNTSSHSI